VHVGSTGCSIARRFRFALSYTTSTGACECALCEGVRYAKEFLSQINTRDPMRTEELVRKNLWNRIRNRCVENAMSYVRDAHRRPVRRPVVAASGGREEKHAYEGIRIGTWATAFSFQCGGLVVILLEIALKNIGLLQSFCYLNVKHPNTMRRGITHVWYVTPRSRCTWPRTRNWQHGRLQRLNDSCRHARREVLR